MAIGLVSWPGVAQAMRCSFTISHGTTPSVATLDMAPQPIPPAVNGTLDLTFGSTFLRFPGCRLNKISYTRSEQGLVWSLQILDRRWRWAFTEITGRYNLRFDDETINFLTEKTPKQLASLLLAAMGEVGYDVSELPDATRPQVDWVNANAAQALDELVNSLGCRVVLQLNNRVRICRAGAGLVLPNLQEIMHDSGELDPPDPPDKLKVVFGPTRIQMLLLCEAVGLEDDGSVVPIDDLSYTPSGDGWDFQVPGIYSGVTDSGETAGPGERETNPRNLAKQTVFRWYRISEIYNEGARQALGAALGMSGFLQLEQILPLYADLVDTDSRVGEQMTHRQAAKPLVQGVFRKFNGSFTNADSWTQYTRPFRLIQDKGIIEFSDYVVKYTQPSSATSSIEPADIYLLCSFPLKSITTNALHRHEVSITTGANNGTGPKVMRREEVSRYLRAYYTSDGEFSHFDTNATEINTEAAALLNEALASYQSVAAQDRAYAGLVPINPDGAIQQVTWSVEQGAGATTRASRNSEYSLVVPPYSERQLYARLRDPNILNAAAWNQHINELMRGRA